MFILSFITVAPSWAVTDEAKAFYLGFACAATIRLFRVGLRWVKGIGDDLPKS